MKKKKTKKSSRKKKGEDSLTAFVSFAGSSFLFQFFPFLSLTAWGYTILIPSDFLLSAPVFLFC